MLGQDAAPLVRHLEDDLVFPAVVPGGERHGAVGAGEGLAGVHQQVDDHLLDPLGASMQFRHPLAVACAELAGALLDQVSQQSNRGPRRLVQVEIDRNSRLLLPREILQVLDYQLDPARPLLHLLHQPGDRFPHPGVAKPRELEIAMGPEMLLQDRFRVPERLHHHRDVQEDEAVGVVDLVRHPGNEDAERRHLVRLHQLLLAVQQLLLGVSALLHLAGQLGRPRRDLALQGARPEHRSAHDREKRCEDDRPVLERLAPGESRRFQDAEPPVVDLLVFAGVLQDGEPLVESGQQGRVPLSHREAVLLGRDRVSHGV